MGRAGRYAVERTPSRARRRATHITVDENRPTSARTFVARPAQANEVESARDGDHDHMRIMRQVNRKVQCAHLPGLMEMFERALRGASHPPFFPHHERQIVRGEIDVLNAVLNLPPDIWRL